MPPDPRDRLWDTSYETYYHMFYQELLADRVIQRWQFFDALTRVLITITATSSAIGSWELWRTGTFRAIWVIMAGAAAVLSIIHTTLNVVGRLKDHGDIRRRCAGLRVDLETFRQLMEIDANFPIKEYTEKYEEYRRRYSDCIQMLINDIIVRQRFARRVQAQLNASLQAKTVRPS
jgi:hypothetical protein